MNSTIQIGRVSSFKVKTLSNVLTRKKKTNEKLPPQYFPLENL